MQQLTYVPRALRLTWLAAPRWTVAWAVLLIVQGILPASLVYLTKLTIDRLVVALNIRTWEQMQPAVGFIAAIAGLMVLSEVVQSSIDWIRAAQAELIHDHITSLLHAQAMAVDLAFYESPAYHDRLDQARSEAAARSRALLESVGGLVQNGITLAAMGALLLPYGLWLPLAFLVSALPALLVVMRFDRRMHRWWQTTTAARRRVQYYDALLTNSLTAAELRLFGLGPHFQSLYQGLRRRLRTERLALLRRQSLARLATSLLSLLVFGATLAWMVLRLVQGWLTLGDLALFYQAFQRGQTVIGSALSSVGQLYANSLFLGNLFEFLALQPEVVDPARPLDAPWMLQHGIEFDGVTFCYPGSDRPALEDFSLTIPAGKVVAIVGANGAGKTTLIKLLCRFYDPQQGQIRLDGLDIRDVAVAELRRRMTVLFQFPVNHHATVAENIALGDVTVTAEQSEVEAAARYAGAHDFVSQLPHDYETMLGRWFGMDGVELSGGEWQRIAMARAFYRQAPIILLDEPTSFMDSWAEADWFDRFRRLTQHRTAVIITHRFTIALRADIIHVMHDGQIVESGTHQELLRRDGLYAESWRTQMQASLTSL